MASFNEKDEEENELRRRLHLFNLALKNTTNNYDKAAGTKNEKAQQRNLYHLLDQIDKTLMGVSAETKASDWFSELSLNWDRRLTEYRSDKNSKVESDEKNNVIFSNSSPNKKEKLKNLGKKPRSKSADAVMTASVDQKTKQVLYNSSKSPSLSTTSTTTDAHTINNSPSHNNVQTPTTTIFHHHYHYHNYYPPPPGFLPLALPPPRLVAPPHLRALVFHLLSLLPPVSEATDFDRLNHLFASVAFIARWCFEYLNDQHGDAPFQTDVFRVLFSKMPALLQEQFLNPPLVLPTFPSSISSFKTEKEGSQPSCELKLVNLLAFLRHFLLGLMMRRRANMAYEARKEENLDVNNPPLRYCAFCKLETSHNIVDCPNRRDCLCHRCFLFGHTERYCRNEPLLPITWLNSGQIKFEEEKINI